MPKTWRKRRSGKAVHLRSVHEPVAEDFYYHQDQRQRMRAAVCDQAGYFLSYEGGHARDDADAVEPYWFIELLQANVLRSQVVDPDFLTRNGYSRSSFQLPPQSTWGASTNNWLERISRDIGMLFIPLDALKLGALVGHAAIQIMTKTGARILSGLQRCNPAVRLMSVGLAYPAFGLVVPDGLD